MDQSIAVETLENGLRIVVEEIPLLRSVSLGLWIGQGSRHEADDQAGLSHFIEHLLFKGTARRSCQEIAEAIDGMGGNLDAFTGREFTSYITKVLDDHFDDALALLAELMLEPRFDAEDIELEREVVLEEIKMVQDSPEEQVHELFIESFYGGHPLGRSILGRRETVSSFDTKVVRDFFERNYRPERMLLSVAGNVRAGDVIEAARKQLGGMERGDGPPPESTPGHVPGLHVREREAVEQVHLLIGANAFGKRDKRRYEFDTLNAYLGGSVSSRLFQNVRERLGLAYAIHSFTNTYADCGLLAVYAATGHDRAGKLLDVIFDELEAVTRGEIETKHVERAKTLIKGDVMLGLENSANRMAFLARQMIYFGTARRMDEVLERLEAVTAESVTEVAADILKGTPITLAAVGNHDGWREEIENAYSRKSG